MSVNLTIAGTTYEYPTTGQQPDWGKNAADWATAVTNTVNGVNSNGDILTTSFNPVDNQIVPANVFGFVFDSSVSQGFIVDYAIYRTNGSVGYSETGSLFGTYNTFDGIWTMAQVGVLVESTGIKLTLTNSGQIQYTSTNLGGTHSCRLSFRARALTSL